MSGFFRRRVLGRTRVLPNLISFYVSFLHFILPLQWWRGFLGRLVVLKVFAIRNAKAGCFENRPFFARSHGEAERVFQNEVTRADDSNFVWKYPEDYDLYFIGEYDELNGRIDGLDTPQHLAKAVQFNTPEKSIHAV